MNASASGPVHDPAADDASAPGPPGPVRGPEVWSGPEIADDPAWIVRLEGDLLDELGRELGRVRDLGLDTVSLRSDHVETPGLAGLLADVRAELLHGRGFVLLRGLDVFDDVDAERAFWLMGQHLGIPQSQNARGDLLGHVTYQGADLSDPVARGYTTRDELRFHCDAADIVGLLCLAAAETGGESLLASSMDVYNQLLARRPDLVPLLFEEWYLDRRDEQGPDEDPYLRTPIAADHDGVLSFWFVPNGLRASQRHPEVPRFRPEQVELLDLIEEICRERALHMDLQPGDAQFVHNFTVIHARTEYTDPVDGPPRHLLRLWLTAPDGRDLSKYPGGGGRQGIAAQRR